MVKDKRILKHSTLTFIAETIAAAWNDHCIGRQIIANGTAQFSGDGLLSHLVGIASILNLHKRWLLLLALFVRSTEEEKQNRSHSRIHCAKK